MLGAWDVTPLELNVATNKLATCAIAGRRYQFRKADYKVRTELFIDISGLLGSLQPLYEEMFALDDLADEAVIARILPKILAAVAAPNLQAVVMKLCATASVSRNGTTFESLADEIVAEEIFGADLSLQVPIAVVAAQFNLGDMLRFLPSADEDAA